jgi:hypothetical protein
MDAGTDGIGFLSGPFPGGSFAVTCVADPLVPAQFTLWATGTSGLSVRHIEESVRRLPGGPWPDALFSKVSMTLPSGFRSDAYDSRIGSYASQATNSDAGGPYALVGGDIGCDSSVDLKGNTFIRGDVTPGPGGSVNLGGGSVVTGSTAPLDEFMNMPSVPIEDFEAALASPSNGTWKASGGAKVTYNPLTRSLAVQGGTITFNAGTYFLRDFSLSSGATLALGGEVHLYSTGIIDLTGGGVFNPTSHARQFQIFSEPYAIPAAYPPGATSVKLTGGANAIYAVYAPDSTVFLSGNADFSGAIVAHDFHLTGSCSFHYDIGLGEVNYLRPPRLRHLYWREGAVPLR